jgi:hypothetical protein
MHVLAATSTSTTSWGIGYAIGIAVVVVVVALVVPILLLAHAIGNQAEDIDESLTQAVHNTAALSELNTTNEAAGVIIAGLERGRHKLGG